nr:hypothetical protein [Tanacetum cinerariifolium]
MTTLAEHMIVASADNGPLMLEKSMYNSWSSRMFLYIKGKEHGRIMLNLVLEGPLVYGIIKVDGVMRLKTYEEPSNKENLQDDCDLRATNIVLQGLPPDVYSLINHHYASKQILDRVKLLILPPEWNQFVTDVQLAKDMHTSNYDQLYVYLSQHEAHDHEVWLLFNKYKGDKVRVLLVRELKENDISSGGNNDAGQARVVKCYNCEREGHMARQCTQPKRPRNSTWIKEKMLLVQA